MKRVIIILAVFAGLSGCATQYGCTKTIGNKGCQSVSAVAKKTQGPLKEDEAANKSDLKSRKKELADNTRRLQSKTGTNALNQVYVGEPILTQPQTMRIYFAPYKDEQGDLNTGGYVYMQITQPEWVLAK